MTNISPIVSTQWLADHLDDANLRILDATTFLKLPSGDGLYSITNGRDAYEQEHIPGAVHADVVNELADPNDKKAFTIPSRERFVDHIEKLGVGDGNHVVIYDRIAEVGSANSASDWASRVWWQLRFEGFEHVSILDGGFRKWKAEGRDVNSGIEEYPRGTFTGERRRELLATKSDVENAIEDRNTILMNCLSPDVFSGKVNTYGRPGHIPGSKNVYFADLSDHDSLLIKKEEELRAIFEPTDVFNRRKKVITYCGGGIAATWNAFILYTLGRKDVAIYDGSMTEWVQDESAPLVISEG
ncbi:thiosulfate/3-mercaptopyruvate sulfurtransferase [Cytobacillus horneckiae]|uniref:Sulfurtransferase n=1 Tax=Cytobacillus horneckiae TaxID=549687 RepID=A0A2N0ZKY5_9BACI|nr:sulfurtransferase [Cytobacillus horneckiae]MBN6885603.1 sulfurtransferase [Cytobacillus horneckiae]MEC1156286.1 sulfurtransferase [Cytobacillus horneckiae]MED2938304.1 sulfurtransferase [Cytobacillus horneckiae]PKG30181.1 sulfurtransferase [Cytobacillus horneckiae]